MLTIYHAPGTRSVRPLWLCYELDLPVEIMQVDFSPAYRNTSEWRAISPAGKVPIMKDGDLTMFESGAMVDYILERYGDGRLHPAPRTNESALYRQWCWFSEATLARPVGIYSLLNASSDGNTISADAQAKLRECIKVVEQAVSSSAFLLGDAFTAADIMMGYSLQLITATKVLDEKYPNAQAYLERLKRRDACKRAMAA